MSKLLRNWPLKLAAVILAVIVWFIIMILADPTDVKTIYNVPVRLLNTQMLTQAGKSYTVEGGEEPTVTIRVSASGSVLRDLDASDFSAVADVSKMFDVTGQVPIEVLPLKPTVTAAQISLNTPSVTIHYENIITKEFDVEIQWRNKLPDGYFIDSQRITPQRIRVRGPEETVVSRIGSVVAEVDVSGLTESTQLDCSLLFYTDSGQIMNLESYRDTQVLQDKVTVSLDVFTMKTVPVVISQEALDAARAQVPEGYRYTRTQQSVTTVQVKGLLSRLADISAVSIPTGSFNMQGATEDKTFTIDLAKYLPAGIELMSGQEALEVTLFVEALTLREFEIKNLEVIGEKSNYSYEIQKPVRIFIQALEADFVGFDLDSVSVILDLGEYADRPGEYTLPLTVSCSDTIFTPLDEKNTVKVTVKPHEPSANPMGRGND